MRYPKFGAYPLCTLKIKKMNMSLKVNISNCPFCTSVYAMQYLGVVQSCMLCYLKHNVSWITLNLQISSVLLLHLHSV